MSRNVPMPLDYPPNPMNARVEELKRYVRFTARDAALLAAFADRARPHCARVAQEFYERIREHEDAHALLESEEQIARLQSSMAWWLERLFGGTYDASYFARTERIGRVHVKVGLPPRYMPAAMSVVRSSLSAIVDRDGGPDAAATRDALSRLLDLELAVMLESYREDYVARIERAAKIDAARTESRYVEAVEIARMLVVAIDAHGAVLLFNREAERITGWARDEVLGRPLSEVLGPLPSEGMHERPLVTRSGKRRQVLWQISPAPGGAAREDAVTFLIGRDTTEEQAAHERGKQQERLAAVGTLAAGLAHEIRNPLNGAQLHVSFLERSLARSSASSDVLEAVRVVREEIHRLARLVTDFLDFARPRPLERGPSDARVLCERAIQLAAADAAKAHVSIEADMPLGPLVFSADVQRLEQVLLNLLQNAIEALEPTGGHVVVRARREPRNAWIEVEDDGPGLPSGDPPVFDAFWSTKPDGTGLGLAIVHRIVTDHGGSVDVDSVPGRTRFRITIPLATSEGTERS